MQIYAATKAAIRAVSDESSADYSNDLLWTGDPQTVAFAKHLINIGRNATAPVEVAIYGYADPTEAVAEGDYYVKTVTVQSSNYPLQAGTKIRLALPPNAPAGAIITDISDNPIPASGVDNFTRIKIKVPKSAVTADSTVNFEVRANLTIESKVILFGLPSDAADQGAYQRYEISMPHQSSYFMIPFEAEVEPDNEPTPTPTPPAETPPPTQTPPPNTPDTPGELVIRKFRTGTTTGLAGAEFKVTNATGGVLGHYYTDSSGTITLNVDPGAYYIDEITPPAGYVLDVNTHKDVVVIADQTAVVTFENEPLPSLEITKIDGNTGQPLAGAVFRVALDNGSNSFDVQTNNSGKASLDNLPPGTYTVEELTAPPGYVLNSTVEIIMLEPGKQGTVIFTNWSKPGIIIRKFDEGTGLPLPGAQFSVALHGGTIVYEGIVNSSGIIVIEDLEPGWYTITEMAAPNGYLIVTPYKDVLLEEGRTVEVKFDNRRRPSLEILKIDSQTNEPLAGAIFHVRKTEDSTVSEHITDASGRILIENLDEAIYTVEEVKAPDGYLLETQHKDIELQWGMTKTLIFENKKRPSLEIIKLDEETMQPLAGAIFRVRLTEGGTTSEYTTGPDGRILITDLEDKIYTVEEIKAPDGYLLEIQHKDILLEWGETKTLVFTNKARPKLEIIKIDSVNGEPLAGVRFRVTKTEDLTISEFVTDSNGRILIENLDEAIYSVEEMAVPDGWILDPERKEILLEWGKTKTLMYDNIRKPTLIVTKTNGLTFQPIPNTTFKIEYEGANGATFLLGSFRTDENGQIIIPKVEPGWYIITETSAAPGFSLPSNPVTRVFLNPGENAYTEYTNGFYTDGGNTTQVTVYSGFDFILGTEILDYPLNSIVIKKVCSVTGELLAGAAFEVRRVTETMTGGSGTLIGRYTTDNSGIIVINGLQPGGYIVEEVQAPPNYLLVENSRQQLWMRWDGTSIEELTFANVPYGNLLVTKVDAVTGAPLGGARFRVTDGTGATAGTQNEYVTDIAGQFLVSNLKPGTYVISEIEAPHGYIIDTEPQTVHIGLDGKTYSASFRNQPIGGLLITKRCSVTMEPLSGAVFQITDSHGAFIGNAANGWHTTDATGTIFFPHIEPGAYVITEVKAPDGYLADMNTQTVHIEYGMVKHADFYNTPLGGLVVTKYDAVTREPLAEAVFRVTDIMGAVVGTTNGMFRTNQTGTFYIPQLPPGGYRVEEIQAPDGYILDNTAQTIHILDERMYYLEFFNQPVNQLVIMKYDAVTMEPLPGATIRVEKLGETTELVGEFTTDSSGRVNVPDLLPGSYSVQELQAPPGYLLDDTVKIVNLVQNKGVVVNLFNHPLGGILIRKYDSQSMQPLPDAVFTIRRQDGTFIGEYTTNHDGFIMQPLLPPGFYVIEEIRAPDGYLIYNSPQTVEVKTNDMAFATFFNRPMSGLTIKKFDAATNEPLMGARFKVSNMSGEVIGEYNTNAYGLIQLTDLEPGWYTAVEISPPPGYKIYEMSQDFEITHTRTVTLEFPNEKLTSLVIKKIDDQTGVPLARAKFIVERINGQHVGEFTTDADGLINIPELAPDWYIVREVQAPDGYLLDEDPKTVEVKTNVPTVVTFSNKKLTALEIIKIDEHSGEPLAGARFAVEKQNGERIGEYVTDGTGLISIPLLQPDWYVVRETRAPDGYLLDETPRIAEVKTAAPTVLTFTNKRLTALQIKKVDVDSGEPLGGARFIVERLDGLIIGEYTTDNTGFINIPTLDPDWYVVRETQAPPGYLLDETPKNVEVGTNTPAVVTFVNKKLTALQIIKIDESTGAPLAGAKFTVERQNGERAGEYTTDAAGIINIPTLAPDWYIVKETFAPVGYLLDETPKTVEVKVNAPTVVTFTNKPLASLQIIKINETTGGPLRGAVFSIERQNGERVGEYTTDAGGVINIPNLAPGWYIVKETRAPSGFLLDEAPRTVEVGTSVPTVITFVNKPLSSILIKKIDEISGAPLPGARFTVEKINGERVGEYVTDRQGFINVPYLEPGHYIVRETRQPDGYLLDETPRTVEVVEGKPIEVTFTNTPLSGLQIKKIDSVTRQPLGGVVFAVSKFSGEKIGDFTTGRDGLIYISQLEPGYYTVTEIRTIEGYHADSEPRTVEIIFGKNAFLEIENVPISSLIIIKTDMQTRKPLEGVRFDISKANGERVGTYTTDWNGWIYVDGLAAGRYHVVETEALWGYERDTRTYEVDMHNGRQTVLEVQNKPLGGLRIKKICAVTGQGIYNTEFMVFDHNNKVVGTFYSDNNGIVDFSAILVEGRYTIRETRASAGYYLDEIPKTVEFVAGVVTEIIWTNVPQMGQIQITKFSANDNEVNGLPAGTPLEGAIFEVYSYRTGNLIDRFITGRDGRGVSNPIPLGRYIVKEVQAPQYYKLNDRELDIYIEFATQIVRLEYTNESANTGVYIKKTGNREAIAGNTICYDIRAVQNTSAVPLSDFFWREIIPVDAARATRLITGTYNQALRYKILATTNRGETIIVADNLSTTMNNAVDLSNASLGLGSDEYITTFTLMFGNVRAGFTCVEQPQVYMTVLDNLPNGYEFANKCDIGGIYNGEWIIGNSTWVTSVYSSNNRLPRTGH